MTAIRRRLWCGIRVGMLLLFFAIDAGAQPVKHILLLQSIDRGSVVFDRVTANFRTALQERGGQPVIVTEFVVAPAGFTEAPEKAIVEFLQAAFADRPRPDLIVTMGGPATAFARRHRQELFPETPLLLGATELRFLRDAPLAVNETSVSVSIDYTRLVDDILQLLPETSTIFMVMGSGPLGRFWHAELERNFAPYRGRLTFIWSDDLSYEQMLQRAAMLPSNSATLFVASGPFATGGWQGEERALATLSTRSNTPVFGVQSIWLGSGTVGGRLMYSETVGATVADVAIRILNGASPGSIRVAPLQQGPPAFDARQLRRWRIPESRLPSGSDIRFQPPSLWRDYRREMVAVVAGLALQSLLIVGLLAQRRARQRAEVESRRHLTLATDASRRLTMSALTGSIAHELSQPINAIQHNAQAGEILIAANRATPQALQEILSDIRGANVRASQIIERHRTMLRSHQLDSKPLHLESVLRESVALVAHDARARHVQVQLELSHQSPVVAGDQVLLQQVFVNLIMNAMDAMDGIPPDQRRVTVREEMARENVDVRVTDLGSGLPQNMNGQLFEPFITTKTHGLGIGLTIARTIVEAHRGTLEGQNNGDRGATFTVTLPRAAVS